MNQPRGSHSHLVPEISLYAAPVKRWFAMALNHAWSGAPLTFFLSILSQFLGGGNSQFRLLSHGSGPVYHGSHLLYHGSYLVLPILNINLSRINPNLKTKTFNTRFAIKTNSNQNNLTIKRFRQPKPITP